MRVHVAAVMAVVAFGCSTDGINGSDGESAELQRLPVGSPECPAGGVLITAGDQEEAVCNGTPGEVGATGAMGKPGTDGQDAAPQEGAWVPETISACGAITNLPSSGVQAYLRYRLVTFTDGSVIAICGAATNGAVGADASNVFAGWQVGAAEGGCTVTSDASGAADGGWWGFSVVNGKMRAAYHDTSTADDGAFYEFKTTDCPTSKAPQG